MRALSLKTLVAAEKENLTATEPISANQTISGGQIVGVAMKNMWAWKGPRVLVKDNVCIYL